MTPPINSERLAFLLSEFRTVTDRREGCSLDLDQSAEVFAAMILAAKEGK